MNNGLVPITVNDETLNYIFQCIEKDPNHEFIVDIESQTLEIDGNLSISFDIDEYKKECILKGYDDIDYLLSIQDQIEKFEDKQVLY